MERAKKAPAPPPGRLQPVRRGENRGTSGKERALSVLLFQAPVGLAPSLCYNRSC